MNFTQQVAKHLRDIHFGGNWTSVNLKEKLEGLSWQEATAKVYSLNSIAALVYHMNYYVVALLAVFKGKPLTAKDKYSWELPAIQSTEDWESLKEKTWADAEELASLIEQFPDSKLNEPFADGKYGNCYRNLTGLIEHAHYHMGQIVVIRKILGQTHLLEQAPTIV